MMSGIGGSIGMKRPCWQGSALLGDISLQQKKDRIMSKKTVDVAPILLATLRDLRQLCRAVNTFVAETHTVDMTEDERLLRKDVRVAIVDVYQNLTSYCQTLDKFMCDIDDNERSEI
jgi:hypothetical protein